MSKDTFCLLDSRAGILGLGDSPVDDFDKYIILIGTAKECCDSANNGEYGDLCVVSDMQGNIMWEWLGKSWSPEGVTE